MSQEKIDLGNLSPEEKKKTFEMMYDDYRRGNDIGGEDVLVKIGVFNALDVIKSGNINQKRKGNILDSIRRKVFRVAEEAEPGEYDPPRSTERATAGPRWLKAYYCSRTQSFDEARDLFQEALNTHQENPHFILDYARLEYNTGRINEAEKLFNEAFCMKDKIITDRTQVYRWLSKVFHFKGEYKKEIETTKEILPGRLKSLITSASSPLRNSSSVDKNAKFSISRLGRAYLRAERPEKALKHSRKYIGDARRYDVASKVAKHGVAAYARLNREEDAREWAGKWSNKLSDASIEAFYLSCVNQPFSASRTRVKNKLIEAAEREENEAPLFFTGPDTVMDGGVVSEKLLLIKKATHQSFRVGLPEEGLELLLEGAAKSIEEDHPRFLASLLSYISEYYESLPKSEKIKRLYKESSNLYPENESVLAQRGHWRLKRGDKEKSKRIFRKAYRIIQEKGRDDHIYEQNLATAEGGCGNTTEARKRFSSVLDSVCKSYHQDDIVIAYREALKWAVSCGEYSLALKWSDEFLDYSGIGVHTHFKAPPIYQYAARAALAENENQRAMQYYRWFRTALAHHFKRTEGEAANYSIQRHVDANYEGSLIAYLTGDEEKGHEWLIQAEQFSRDSTLKPAVEAVEASIAGVHREAVQLLLNNYGDEEDTLESTNESWILKAAGRYVIQQAQGSDVDHNLLRELQYRVEIASGSFPEAKELKHRLDQQVTSLKEAQDAAQEAKRRSEVLQDAFEKLVKDLPLPSDTQKARQNLVEAIHDNREISSPVSNFVDTLDDSLKKLDLDWDTYYEEKIGKDAWRSLDSGIKQRLISAANYVKLARESGYDFGPAVLALSSGLERLLDINLVNPLYQEIRYQPDSNKIVNESPVSDFRRVTLGQIPYLLGVKNNLGKSNYKKVLERWLSKNFSNDELSYLNNELGSSIETIQPVRNEWAHGSTVVGENTYDRCEEKLIENNKNPFSMFH